MANKIIKGKTRTKLSGLILDKRMEGRVKIPTSLRAASRISGISHPTLSRLENGSEPDVCTLEKLSDWLGIPMSEVLAASRSNASLS